LAGKVDVNHYDESGRDEPIVTTLGPGRFQGGLPSLAAVDERILRLGAELAAIGNCNDCHVANSGTPYAGARPIPTPFGTIFSRSITPDG
jgi:hypothetical protein